MRLITGDECGLLKETIPELNRSAINGSRISSTTTQYSISPELRTNDGVTRLCCAQSNLSDQNHIANDALIRHSHESSSRGVALSMNRSQGVVGLAFCPSVQPKSSIAFCSMRLDGTVERWEGVMGDKATSGNKNHSGSAYYTKTHSWTRIFGETLEGERPLGICSSQRYQNSSRDNQDCTIACCTSNGSVCVFRMNRDGNSDGTSAYEPYGKVSSPKIAYTKGQFTNKDLATSMAMDYDGRRLAVGGREREILLLDVTTGGIVWKAKNLPPNPQTLLQQPIWTSTMTFLSPTDTSSISDSTHLLAAGTAYKQVRIYDVRENSLVRRPVIYTPEFDSDKLNLFNHRLTSICQLNSNAIVVGDAAGYIHTLDLRKIHQNANGRCMTASIGRYSGPAGSVRQIVKHEDLPIIACVGLDRMLRTYDALKRKPLDCVYLRQRLNCMLLCADGHWTSPSIETEDEEQEELPYVESDSCNEEDEVQDYVCSDEEEDHNSDGNRIDDEAADDPNSDDEWTDDSSSSDDSSSKDEYPSDSDAEEPVENKRRANVDFQKQKSSKSFSKRRKRN